MQTFLPYPGFAESARVLDTRRLGKQHVETIQVLRWLGDMAFHRSHHAALVRKDPLHYRVHFPGVPDDRPCGRYRTERAAYRFDHRIPAWGPVPHRGARIRVRAVRNVTAAAPAAAQASSCMHSS